MSALGSLVFCTDCGNLLDESTGDKNTILTCDLCGTKNRGLSSHKYKRPSELQLNYFSDIESKIISSESKPSAFPSTLRSKRSAVQTLTAEDRETTATIQRRCPKCGRSEMRFYTQQLRSADEGSTVFFTCECGFKYELLGIFHLIVDVQF